MYKVIIIKREDGKGKKVNEGQGARQDGDNCLGSN